MLSEDIKVREYLKKKLAHASVGRVIIERPSKNARITIYSSRPGIVIGKKGEDIEVLRGELQRRMGVPVHVNIEEIRKPEIDAQLIADNIAQQLEKRIMFRRAMKRAMQNAMRLGAQGIKIMSSGRLNGIEIARREWYREGRVPLHTLRADLDYGTAEAKTTYGVIGIKVWVFKGEVIGHSEQSAATPLPAARPWQHQVIPRPVLLVWARRTIGESMSSTVPPRTRATSGASPRCPIFPLVTRTWSPGISSRLARVRQLLTSQAMAITAPSCPEPGARCSGLAAYLIWDWSSSGMTRAMWTCRRQ